MTRMNCMVNKEDAMRRRAVMLVMVGAVSLVAAGVVDAAKTPKYEEAAVSDGGTITGKVTFKGTTPAPMPFELAKFPNSGFCGEGLTEAGGLHQNVGVELVKDDKGEMTAKKGERLLHRVRPAKDGALQDAIVFLKVVEKGKPFALAKDGTDVAADRCRFLVQGGPSPFVGVIARNAEVRFTNEDNVLHNPHGFEIRKRSRPTLFNKPLNEKGSVVKETVKKRWLKKSFHMFVQCDQHEFMRVHFVKVQNPYYTVVGGDGAFTIGDVPPGTYTLVAWHPTLGSHEQEVTVSAKGKVSVTPIVFTEK